MTALIDTIEDAVQAASLDRADGVVPCAPVVEAIETYCKIDDDGIIETITARAYLDAERIYGSDWHAYSGHVAELVCDGLRRFAFA
jgi:hypothetical protein